MGQRQEILSKDTLDYNVDAVGDAWAACSGAVEGGDDMDRGVATRLSCSGREDLADATLRAWLGVNLLGDPFGNLVEVKNKAQGRELRGQ